VSDAIKYWDDADFAYRHYPKVNQALVDGETAEGAISLIPDGRLLRVNSAGNRINRVDVVPRTEAGELSWAIYMTLSDKAHYVENSDGREKAIRIAENGAQESLVWAQKRARKERGSV